MDHDSTLSASHRRDVYDAPDVGLIDPFTPQPDPAEVSDLLPPFDSGDQTFGLYETFLHGGAARGAVHYRCIPFIDINIKASQQSRKIRHVLPLEAWSP